MFLVLLETIRGTIPTVSPIIYNKILKWKQSNLAVLNTVSLEGALVV